MDAGAKRKLVKWGKLLRAARESRGLTQEQVAREVSLHRHTIRAIETGSPGVRISDWLALAHILHVQMDFIPPIEIDHLV